MLRLTSQARNNHGLLLRQYQNPAGFAIRVFYCLLFLNLFSPPVSADNIEPFASRDQNPFTLIFGLPSPVAAGLPAENNWLFSSTINLSNTINLQQNSSEQLFVDIESYQLNLTLDKTFRPGWMASIELSFVRYGSGFMDDWIVDYHRMMGLPQGIRPALPADQFHIEYQRNGNNLLNIQQGIAAVGDTTFKLAHQIEMADDAHLSLWGSIKIPTGSSQKLSGSGALDIALWLAYEQKINAGTGWYFNGGNVFLGQGDVLVTQQKSSALFATAGLQFHPWQPVLLKAQLDMHQRFYDSALKFLGDVVQITFGGSLLINKNSRLDLAVAEDIQVAASPDVNFNIRYTTRY